MNGSYQQWVAAFTAGFVATLVFHQGVIGVFWLAGLVPAAPWNMAPVAPLDIPQVISLAFWGGVWGLPIWALMRRWQGLSRWLVAVVAGAVGPTLVAMLVVFPLKGIPVDASRVVGGLIVNGAWGFGVACWMAFATRQLGASVK